MLTDSKKWKNFKEIISVLQSIFVIVGILIAICQISILQKQVNLQTEALNKNNKISSANYVLELSKRLDVPKYDRIMKAIGDNDKNYPILVKSGGHFRDAEVDNLLGLYDSIGNLYQEKLILREMAYNEFSDDFEAA